MKLLLSGFEAFDGLSTNPSADLLPHLQARDLDFSVETVLLPVSFERAFLKLKEKIDATQPTHTLAMGLAQTREKITLERIAINIIEARIPDNDGNQPQGVPVVVGGSDGLFATLPLRKILKRTVSAPVPVVLSNTAGTYVCNSLMYEILNYSKEQNYKAGFLHLPPVLGHGEQNFNKPGLVNQRDAAVSGVPFADLLTSVVGVLEAIYASEQGDTEPEVRVNMGCED